MKGKVKNGKYVDALEAVCWHKDGLLHREDEPATEWKNGTKVWYLKGVEYSKEELQ